MLTQKKQKFMVFNCSGRIYRPPADFCFKCGPSVLEIASEYVYLGFKLKPSGSFTSCVEELNLKATKAWFSISNTIFQHKKLPVTKAFRIFDAF